MATNTGPILSALVLGTFLNGLMWFPYHCQLAYGWTGLAFKANVVAVIVLVPTIFWLVPQYGGIGAAWIWVALNSGYVLVSIQLMHRRILRKEKLRWYGADLLLPFVGAVVPLMLAVALQPTPSAGRLTWALFLLVAGGVALVSSAMMSTDVRRLVLARVLRRQG